MESPRELWHRVVRGSRRDELDEEIRYHIDRQTEKNIRGGMPPDAARRAALVKFGGVERTKEAVRDESRPVLLEDFTRDVQFGARMLRRSPAFAIMAILTLALGIGTATAVFSVVRGVLLKPLDYPQADRVVRVFQLNQPENQRAKFAEPNYLDVKAAARGFSRMAQLQLWGAQGVTGAGEPHQANFAVVESTFFDVIGVYPARGRGFVREELSVGAPSAAIVSDRYWRERLGARGDFGDVSLQVDGTLYRVVGVMPAGFDYPSATEVWLPRELRPAQPYRTGHNWDVIARLAPAVTLEQANAELGRIARSIKEEYGEDTWMNDAIALPLQQQMTEAARSLLLILMGASLLLLVIACANVTNLLLARGATRTRELAVRLAMGAGHWRVARQLLAESLVLSTASGALGLLIAYAGVRVLLALEPGNLPLVDRVGIDPVVLGFAVAMVILVAAVLSLATALRAARTELRHGMAESQRSVSGGRSSQRVRDTLVVAQVTLTLILLIGAGLLTRSFVQLLNVDPGFDTSPALIVDLRLDYPESPEMQQAQIAFQDELIARVRQLPGVTAAGLINAFPLGGGNHASGRFIEMTRPDEISSLEQYAEFSRVPDRIGEAEYRIASPEYFRAMGIPLIRGRMFSQLDCCGQPHVALISESLARTKWPDQDPIGRFIQFGNMDGDIRPYTIVGVVGDLREFGPANEPRPMFYGNSRQRAGSAARFSLVLRGPGAVRSGTQVSAIIKQLNPQLPISMRTMDEAVNRTLATRRFSLILISVFSAAALILATLGMYGVISYLVAQRTREIGIRMALGADAGSVLRMIVGRGARLALIGVVLGVLGALGLTRFLAGMLYGVTPTDPAAYASVVALIVGAVLLACYMPARRALGIAPAVTLRAE